MKRVAASLSTIIFIITFSCLAYAQPPRGNEKEICIPDGMPFSAVTTEAISSKTALRGDMVTLSVLDDVLVDGTAVIKKGTLVKGVVTRVRPRRSVGTKGYLILNIVSTTTADNQQIKLRGLKREEGEGKKGVVVGLGLLVGPFALLKHGTDAEINAGTVISVNTDEPKTVHVGASSGVKPSVDKKDTTM